MRPFNYPDSKSEHVKEIINEFPVVFPAYHEPFCGSSSVFFSLVANKRIFQSAFLSDSNQSVIDCLVAIRDEPDRVSRVLTHCLEKNSKEFYENMLKSSQSPAVFIYLMRAGIYGKWRQEDFVNRKIRIAMETESIYQCSTYLNKYCTSIERCEWDKHLTRVNPGDVVYYDPPRYFQGWQYLKNICDVLISKGAHVFATSCYLNSGILGEPFKVFKDCVLWKL